MILEEAILNAWKHGNKKNPNKSITVRRRFGNDFHLEVIDEGRGFDPECALDPTSPENLTKLSGRGIFLIRHYADEVAFEKEGKQITITLEKHLYHGQKKTAKHTAELVKMLKA
jgi:anti-sigma regulatory factor (Ser/Thr protein kinase)